MVTSLANKDPHFAIPLSTGQQLCYSMQGLANFIFNLISHPNINVNAYFIAPEKDKNLKEYATFLGDIGIMIQPDHCMGDCRSKHITTITISASDRSILLDGSKTVITDRPVHVLVDNSTTTIQLGQVLTNRNTPSLIVSIKKPRLSVKINFVNEHLDLMVMDDSGISSDCHGIMGQFLHREAHVGDGLMKINGKVIEIEEKPMWDTDDIPCLHAKPQYGYQAEGIIEGKYTDYIMDSLFSPRFQYRKFKM
ncbi:inter-alpha-trypsin inhibitor heavy chain H5-like [Dysidea avara]|uniref:inter-alpha-trypsin inhibitor heavy chain H5-like n=1 Tax=Dysidea avara TaxID=196820 RepID=UPI003319BB38